MGPDDNRMFSVTGQVFDRPGGVPRSGLRVQVWDRDVFFDDALGEATTDDSGHFSLLFSSSRFRDLLLDRKPDLFALVYEGRELLTSTRDTPLRNVDGPAAKLVLFAPQVRKPAVPAAPQGTHPGVLVLPAAFGQLFLDAALTAGTVAERANRMLPTRHFRQTQHVTFGPVQVDVIADAVVGAASAEKKDNLQFDVVFPVEIALRVTGAIGPLHVSERFDIETRVTTKLRCQIFDTLRLYLDVTPVLPETISVTIEAESWTQFTRGEVDRGVRTLLANKFNENLMASGPDRTIDIRALIERFASG